ncbi:MAG: DNA polymerase III subunit delta [Flavobacteriales bacterium]|nr:DNA polymerase III subunit delta [Flavobacteriales bacterium]MDG1781057.1 DNA polymerase III subunit delta [Flavobacteriales bacterium]MDG2246219.1 DNA polymerase III subunit delta [Flavobacteriales bacterium]
MAKKANTIGFVELRNRLRNKDFGPIYLIQGEEPWFIDELVDDFEKNVLEEHERDFNMTVVYGADSSFDQIVSAAQRFPMMAERQLIVVKEAQDLDGWRREADREYLLKYLESPQNSTVLVFAHKYKKVASNTRIYKGFDTHGVVFNSDKLRADEMPSWIVSRAKDLGVTLAPTSSQLIAEYLGSDLGKVQHAIEKLQFTVGSNVEILPEHIEKYIGISKDYNVFELQRAICVKDYKKTAMIIKYFEANPKDNNINMVLGFLITFFTKLLIYHSTPDKSNRGLASAMRLSFAAIPEFKAAGANYPVQRVMQAFTEMRQMDRRLKGIEPSTTSDADQLREFLFGLMN